MDSQLLLVLLVLAALLLVILGTGFRYYQKPLEPERIPAFIRALTVEPPSNLKLASTHHEEEDLGSGKTKHVQHMRLIAYDRGAGLRRCTNIAQTNQGGDLPIQLREAFDLDITDKLVGNKPAIRFGKGQSHVNITPLNTNRVNVTNPDPATWLYRNAWNNADYRLIAANHKLDKAILLRAGHPSQFAFELSHAGLNLETLSTPDFRILQPSLEKDGVAIPLEWLVSQQGGKTILTAVLPVGNWAGWVMDPTLTLQPDGTDGKDARIDAGTDANTNYGTNTALDAIVAGDGTFRRGLCQFTLTSIPAGSTITLGTYSLKCRTNFSAAEVSIRGLVQSWTEGGATWNTYDGTNNWTTAGGDLNGTIYGTVDPASYVSGTQYDFTITALVQAWVSGTLTNNGLLAKVTTETGTSKGLPASSSDNATPANRPLLTVVYTLPATGMVRSPMWGRF